MELPVVRLWIFYNERLKYFPSPNRNSTPTSRVTIPLIGAKKNPWWLENKLPTWCPAEKKEWRV